MRIENIEKNQVEILDSLTQIRKKNEEMFNHFTETYEQMFKEAMNKTPMWVSVIGTIAGGLIGALIVWALTH